MPPRTICTAPSAVTPCAAPAVWMGGEMAVTETFDPADVGGTTIVPTTVVLLSTAATVVLTVVSAAAIDVLVATSDEKLVAGADGVGVTLGTVAASVEAGAPGRMMLSVVVAPQSASGVPTGQQPASVLERMVSQRRTVVSVRKTVRWKHDMHIEGNTLSDRLPQSRRDKRDRAYQ